MKTSRHGFTIIEIMVVVVVIFAATIASRPFFGTDSEGATRVLAANGYTTIEITGYRWFTGGEGDFYHTGFRAKSPGGQFVTGTVTRGLLFKGATIRFD